MTNLRRRIRQALGQAARGKAARGKADRGSMAVEFVVAVPGIIFLLVLISAGGQWINVSGQVGSAARDAVRAASLARSFDAAQDDAQAAAAADLTGVCVSGPLKVTVTPVQGGAPVGAGDFATAQEVTVLISCPASFTAFNLIGFAPSHTFSDTAAAPLDPFEDRTT
jgi:Flp pilus assembly protein TadG